MMRKEKGFTLIELMIVVVIIGILAAIAIPNFMSMRNRAKEASTKSNMHTVQLGAEDFSTLADGSYPVQIETTVANVCPSCDQTDTRKLADVMKPPFDITALLPDNLKNPFVTSNNSLANDGTATTSGITHYYDFASGVNAAQGYSVRGVGSEPLKFMSLVLTAGQ